MFTYNREGLNLNGDWKFCPDPMQRCRRQRWWVNRPGKTNLFPCFDPEGLWTIQVPGTWKTQFEELKWYDGHAVYYKTFDFNGNLDDREAFLCFDGVLYEAEVYLNGILVGSHEWGYSPFQMRITEMLQPKNELFILVDATCRPDRVPGEFTDFNSDGGIINPVKLITVPVTHVKNFQVTTQVTECETEIKIALTLNSRDTAARESVHVAIPELSLTADITATVGTPAMHAFTIPRDQLTLWSPKTPKLYEIRLSTSNETLIDDVGFREIRVSGGDILLNGDPIRLHGMSTHSEFPDTGRTATPAGVARMISFFKELDLNFVRCAHYPYAEIFGREFDRAGLLWWAEVPAYWLANMAEEGQTRQACGMLSETIQRDWNRASLIIWSVSNECCWRNPKNYDETNYPYWFKAVDMIRNLDPSRLISCAEAGNRITKEAGWTPDQGDAFNREIEERWIPGHTDEWYQLFDILAANIYVENPGEAAKSYRAFVKMLKNYNKPLMLSEFGSQSLRGCDDIGDAVGAESWHAASIREAYAALAEHPEIKGYAPWCLGDIRVPQHWRWYNQGKGVFRYGFLDENWERKEKPFAALKECIQMLKQKFSAESD